jgi:nitrogenase molybdenum-iron protein alpha/beta subunit
MGAPVGFEAMDYWTKTIGKIMKADMSKIDIQMRRARGCVFRKIKSSMYSRRVKCSRFTVMADSSVAYPLTKWLYEYLCMLPVSISVDPGEDKGMVSSLQGYLGDAGLKETWNSDPAQKVDFMFTDGHTAESQVMMGNCRKGIHIAMPTLYRVNFIPRPLFGISGSMYILDEIFSSL